MKKTEEFYKEIEKELTEFLNAYKEDENFSFFHDLDERDNNNLLRSLKHWRERTIIHLLIINKQLEILEEIIEVREMNDRINEYLDESKK